jgi:hypothetical protein
MSSYRMPAVLPQPDTGVPADSTLPGLRVLAKLAAFAHSFLHSFPHSFP